MTYHVVIEGKAAGPYTAQQLAQMGIKPEALVWHQGLPNWVAASSIQEIVEAVQAAKPKVPEVPQPPVVPTPAPQPKAQEPTQPQYEPQPQPVQPQYEPQPQPAQPQYEPQPAQPMVYEDERPSNNLVMAIIGCVLFFPVGIPAIIKAASVNRLWNEGQHELAEAQSASAKKLGLIAIIIGAVFESLAFFTALL